jgi:hypothetical protein
VDTNGGQLEIPMQFEVVAPSKSIALRTLGAGILVGEIFAFYRVVIELLWPQYRYSIMPAFTLDMLAQQWMFIPLAVVMITVLLGSAYYVYAFYQIHDL